MVDKTPTEESLTANNEQKIQSEEIIPVQDADDVELSIPSDNQETEPVSEKKVNPLLKQKEQKKEKLLTTPEIIRCAIFGIVSICVVISAALMQQTDEYVPTYEYQIIQDPGNIAYSKEPVNKMEGSFQSGVEEYEYEEVLTTVIYQPSETIFIGGPRVEALGKKVLTDVQFVTTTVDNLAWLSDDAEFLLEETTDKKLCVVSSGLNELDRVDEYAQLLNTWASRFPSLSFVFVNFGPVDENLTDVATNKKIYDFNLAIKEKLSDSWRYVDLYGYLVENGIESADGLNYSESLNTRLFAWILSQVDTEEKIEYVPIIPEGSSE